MRQCTFTKYSIILCIIPAGIEQTMRRIEMFPAKNGYFFTHDR
jgi:hypothetical protein